MSPRALVARWSRTLETRAAGWARRRQGEDRLPVVLQRRRLYILPTRAGAGFAVLLLAMLIAGLNYANSLALLLAFVLGGFAIIGMNHCHRNLLGLRLGAAHAEPAFAGETVRLVLALDSPAAGRFDLAVEAPGADAALAAIAPDDATRLELRLPALRRGRLHIGRLRLASAFPFGLFRCWTWIHLPLATLVYPHPAGTLPPPAGPAGRESGNARAGDGSDELRDLRAFRDGDSPRQVAWKAYARGQPLLVKEYDGGSTESLHFDFDALPGLDTEARLSQLCRWVLDAEARGQRYGLRLPGQELPPDRGPPQLARCLAALALHDTARERDEHG
ncbi:MAG: DUF58 domain-containing protein [Gammaproteobacteria bacterium]|nr:DUF58 domain-containing protein [Gammaproteobacteria bacterium]